MASIETCIGCAREIDAQKIVLLTATATARKYPICQTCFRGLTGTVELRPVEAHVEIKAASSIPPEFLKSEPMIINPMPLCVADDGESALQKWVTETTRRMKEENAARSREQRRTALAAAMECPQ